MKKLILKIKDITKIYNDDSDHPVKVLSSLSFDVEEGDFISIIGSNGTGKSTIFKIISNQIAPTKGDIIMNEESILGKKEYDISKDISQIKQQPNDNLILSLTLFENLCLAKIRSDKASLSVPKRILRREFQDILRPLSGGLEERLDDIVRGFSGGQKQTIALIMAIINKPKILLLDEHTASLDPVNSEKIIELTKKLVAENKTTTLMITHNITHAIEVGNRLLLLADGKVKLDIHGEEKKNLKIEDIIKALHKSKTELEVDIE
ncbi:MAG: ATP-binding cassette domain-containing protein [Candidatus Pacebacteria bacterium]|nr:ATP-binding cassette domain-containing protein [Candidatus Paceibacterota bacterium]